MNTNNLIIIPDVHGREFWKEVVRGKETSEIVFLGDYLDPYAFEGISTDKAWDIFMEIVEFKKAHPDTVHLLLGNHDLGYLDVNINNVRRDRKNAARNKDFFQKNIALFDIAFEKTIAGKRYLFTHAGVNSLWYLTFEFSLFKGKPISAKLFNSLFHSKNQAEQMTMMMALSFRSAYRGGDDEFGSAVWTDLYEFAEPGMLPEDNLIQIFGHTMLNDGYVVVGKGKAFCIDSRQAFNLDKNGRLTAMKN